MQQDYSRTVEEIAEVIGSHANESIHHQFKAVIRDADPCVDYRKLTITEWMKQTEEAIGLGKFEGRDVVDSIVSADDAEAIQDLDWNCLFWDSWGVLKATVGGDDIE